MKTPQEAVKPSSPQRPAVTASNPFSPRHMTCLGLTNWPSLKYDGFLANRQAWLLVAQEPPGPVTIQDAQTLPPGRETCFPTTTVDCGTQTGICDPTTTTAKLHTPKVTKELSESEKLKLVFGSASPKHQFSFNFIPNINRQPTVQPPVQISETPVAAPVAPLPPNPRPTPAGKLAKRRSPHVVAQPTTCPEESSPYDKMAMVLQGGERSRHLAKRAARMTDLGDRIVMYTDGSAKHVGIRRVPRTAAVTYKLLYGGVSGQAEPWHDDSYGVLGVYGANEAEVVAVAEALGTLEQEVRAYVQSRPRDATASSQLLVFLFSDSDYCLGILDKMLVALRKQGPFTGRDSTVEQLKANLRKLGEYLRSTDLQIRLEFHCIKSHSKIVGNDRADRLAAEAFHTAKLYFSGHQPIPPSKHEVVDISEMSRALRTWRRPDSAASSTEESSLSTRSIATDKSQSVTDDSSVATEYLEFVMEASKPGEELSKTSEEPKASECINPDGQPQLPDAGEHTASPPLSDVYQTIADLKREFQEQRDEERQQGERMTLKFLEAVEELKKASQVATTLVDGNEVAVTKPKQEKPRKRDVLAATIRRAGKRLYGLGRKSKST